MNLLLLIIGVILLVFGVIQFLKGLKLSKNGIKMEAEIVDVRKKKNSSTDVDGYSTTSDFYYPVFKYVYEGKEYTKESNMGVSNSKKYQVGAKLGIVFMSDTPERVKIGGFIGVWILPVILLLVGVVFIIVSFVV